MAEGKRRTRNGKPRHRFATPAGDAALPPRKRRTGIAKRPSTLPDRTKGTE